MKKQTIVLATLMLATCAATAQSEVALYGTIDIGYGVGNGGVYEGIAGIDSKFQQWGNGRSTSVWGLKGEEALGNGNKIYFQLESGLNPETGEGLDGSNGLFSEKAFIGISGNFGSVQAGKQPTVSRNILGEFDITVAPGLTSALGNAGISGYSQRLIGFYSTADSSLVYMSPNFSGFAFQAGLILKNDAGIFSWWGPSAKTAYTLGASYSVGNLLVGAAFESKPVDDPLIDISASWGLGAKYDFGKFVVAASYFDNHFKVDGKGFSLGVSVPINAFEVGAQIAYNTKAYSPTTRDKIKPLAWELYTTYNLSQRTQLYAQYGGINNDAQDFNNAARKYSMGVGVTHSF